jgi:hypothetical protein
MPNWKDEIKAEIEDLGTNVDAISPTGKEFRELIALILELIDHIPDDDDDDEGELEPSIGPATFGVLEGYSGFSGFKGIYADTEEPK